MRASKILQKNDIDKNEKEHEIVTQFLARLQYSPTSIKHPERPDFDVEIADKIIGIEITEYYADASIKGSNTKRLFSEWTKFTKKLKAELKKIDADYDYAYGVVSFDSNTDKFRFFNDKKCFKELLLLVDSNRLNRREEKQVIISEQFYPALYQYIQSISLINTYPESNLWWDSSFQSGWILNDNGSLKQAIDKKEEESKKYRSNNYFQKWLVIYWWDRIT